jgi:hypothetical protein
MNRSIYIQALEMEKSGDWDGSHRLIQQYFTPEACWIHAYLHRVEGDPGNAAYWYARAGKSMPDCDLQSEWQELMNHMHKE